MVSTAVAPTLSTIGNTRRWSVVALLCFGMMIAYFDRVNLSVALALPAFQQQFQLTDTLRGTLNSAFFWSYFLVQIPAGFFIDRHGVKWPYAAGLVVWSLLSASTGWVSVLWQLLAIRLLLGVFESVVTPAGMRWIRFNCAENQRGLAIGLYMAAAKIGPGIGTPLATWLIVRSGWQNMFLIIGLGCLLWVGPWLALVKNDDRELERSTQRQPGAGAAVPFARIMASPVIWGTVIGTFCYQYFVYFCMTWMPSYLVERRGLSLQSMGAYTGFSFLGMATVATAAGFVADRLIDRGWNPVRVRKGFTIAGFLMASTELIGAFSGSDSVALFFAIFSLSGLGLMTANYWALTQTLIPGAAIGRIVGVQNSAANASGIVAPLVTGWLLQVTGSYEAPMLTIALFLIAGLAAYIFLVREKYAPKGV